MNKKHLDQKIRSPTAVNTGGIGVVSWSKMLKTVNTGNFFHENIASSVRTQKVIIFLAFYPSSPLNSNLLFAYFYRLLIVTTIFSL